VDQTEMQLIAQNGSNLNAIQHPKTFCSWSVFVEYQQADFAERVRQLVDIWGA
jgi:hypothetical protein